METEVFGLPVFAAARGKLKVFSGGVLLLAAEAVMCQLIYQ
jgi:hypothetical protein